MLPHTYYNNGSVLVKVKVIGGTPIENEVNWMLDLSFMTLTLQPGQLGGSYTALNSQVSYTTHGPSEALPYSGVFDL